MVQAVRNEVRTDASFDPDGPVLASTHGLTEQKRAVAVDYVDDLTPFHVVGHARYQGQDDSVEKEVVWDGSELTTRCFDALTSIRTDRSDRPSVTDTIAALPNPDVYESADTSVDAGTKRRLEELGHV